MSRSVRTIVLSAIPAWFVLAVEVFGGRRFGKDPYSQQYAIHLGFLYPLMFAALVLSIFSPLFVVYGFRIAIHSRRELGTDRVFILLTLLTFSLLVGMFGCAWSCSGHPTWMGGYTH